MNNLKKHQLLEIVNKSLEIFKEYQNTIGTYTPQQKSFEDKIDKLMNQINGKTYKTI